MNPSGYYLTLSKKTPSKLKQNWRRLQTLHRVLSAAILELKERGIIKGYPTQLERKAIGLDVAAFIEVKLSDQRDGFDSIEDEINKEARIIGFWRVAGPTIDYILYMVAENQDIVTAFVDKLHKEFSLSQRSIIFVIEEIREMGPLPLDHLKSS